MKFDSKFRRRRPSDKWTDLLVGAIIIAIGAELAAHEGIGAAAPLWIVGAAYVVAVAWQIYATAPKEPEVTDAASAKAAAVVLEKQSVEPPPSPGDEGDEDLAREFPEGSEDRRSLEALWKVENHRREYPNCRYCKFLDEEKAAAADKAVIDDAEPGTRGAL